MWQVQLPSNRPFVRTEDKVGHCRVLRLQLLYESLCARVVWGARIVSHIAEVFAKWAVCASFNLAQPAPIHSPRIAKPPSSVSFELLFAITLARDEQFILFPGTLSLSLILCFLIEFTSTIPVTHTAKPCKCQPIKYPDLCIIVDELLALVSPETVGHGSGQ